MVAVRDFRDLPYFPSGCSNPDYCLCSEIQNYIMFVVAMLKSRLSPGFEASKIYLVRFRDVQIPCKLLLLGLHGLIVFIAGILKFCAWLRA